MRHYCLYCLDGTGRISLAEWIDAADDDDAIRQAHDLKRGALKCEIWLGTRLVATIDAQALSASR
jgi:hypothetical protein